MSELSSSIRRARVWVVLSYLAATAAAFTAGFFCRRLGYDVLTTIAVADLVGTLVVFGFSYRFDNSSFYDPYWSVIPILIAGYLAWLGWGAGAAPPRVVLILSLVALWGVRLTYNWARGWRGLRHQDWRYDRLEQQTGRWYWLVSLLGIHLFPTLLVYLGCLSLYPALALPGRPFNILDVLAALVTLGAILVETLADEQLHRFVRERKNPRSTLTDGLWRYSRHPNYFGETFFWWGLFLFALAARPADWWVVAGPLAITLLFNFISIPMIEQRMRQRRDDYDLVERSIPRWIPGVRVKNRKTEKPKNRLSD